MNYSEVLEKLTSRTFFNSFAGLGRMKVELAHFGNPHEQLPTIHVAGTNGKGSVCAMLHSILRQAGYKVGLFTSPFLEDFRERIQINGEMISKYDLTVIGEEVFSYTDMMEEPPNQFEVVTIIAMLYFLRSKCDVVILETGLGGTFDPTNVVPKPILSIITNIGLDHSAILGKTIPEIAAAKAGILKKNVPCIAYPSGSEAIQVISSIALKADAPLTVIDKSDVRNMKFDGETEHFTYKNARFETALPGVHQAYNSAVVLEAVYQLNRSGFYITDADIGSGLKLVKWPARLEILNREPLIYLDGGHNPQCVEAVVEFFKKTYPKHKVTFVVSILQDKDYETMLTSLCAYGKKIYFVKNEHPRAIPSDQLPELCERFGMEYREDCEALLRELCDKVKEDEIICLTGSLFLAGHYRKAFRTFKEK